MHGLIQAALAKKLDRIAAGYAVAGWLAVQIASTVLPAFEAPAWALRAFIIAIVMGFPAALAIAWFMARPDPSSVAPVEVSHREVVLVALLGIVLLLSLGEFIFVISRAPSSATPSINMPPQASIAVLAFNNMSDDPRNEYFSDGIAEELLNDLAQIRGLHVAGRTSSFSFKGKSATISAIGRALNVHTVLEGSVQRVGDRVRITAQLIDAANDDHVWSRTYDRQIADIFAVEDEIAQTITRELAGRLLPHAAAPAKPRIDPDAYTAYLKGRFFLNKRNDADMARAIDFFKKAIARDPRFADAHAALGHADLLLFDNGQRRDTLEAGMAETAAALRFDSGNAQAAMNKAAIAMATWNWTDSYAAYRKAAAGNPGNSDLLHDWAALLWKLNLQDAAIATDRRAAAIDPLAPIIPESIGDELLALKRPADAVAEYQAALTIDPNFEFALTGLCAAYANMGSLDAARKILHERLAPADSANGSDAAQCGIVIAVRSGNAADVRKYVADATRFFATGDITASAVGWFFALAGDDDAAMGWFEKAYDARDSMLFLNVTDPDLPARFTTSARWKAFLQRPLIREWQAAHDLIAAEIAAGR
jgi:serine/threonine-protein kinase